MENPVSLYEFVNVFHKTLHAAQENYDEHSSVKELLYNSHGNMAISDSDFSTKIALFPL